MIEMARNHYPSEVGTSLVGCYSDDGFDAFVLDIAPFTADSQGSPFSFVRGVKGLRKFFIKLRKTFSGKRYYIGEWHSHPDAPTIPSSKDDETQLSIAFDSKTNCPENILIIVGSNLFSAPELGIFVYSRKRKRIGLFPEQT